LSEKEESKPEAKKFVHLHTHSDFSLLDGAISPQDIVKLAVEDGQPGVAITDHGTMAGIVQLFESANSAGITPIPGLEAYYVPDVEEIKAQKASGASINKERFHMILLAETTQGYKNLLKIQSISSMENYYYKPLVDDALLEKYHEGIIATTGCLGSFVNKALTAGDFDLAVKTAKKHQKIFGRDNYFVEIQNHNIPDQLRIIPDQLALAKAIDAPLLATQDSHYGHKEDAEMHDAILAIQTGSKLSDENRFRFESYENYFRTAEEMWELFPEDKFPGACANTLWIEERARGISLPLHDPEHYLIPTFPTEDGKTEKEQLREDVLAGAKDRYGVGRDKKLPQEIVERIEYELGVIDSMGFNGYFLMVADLISAAREMGYLVGPGRGSAPGSIVSYCTGITSVDPIKYGLYFERFLNPGRKSMPDIDIDFEPESRAHMVKYVQEKYGSDRVAKIATYSTLKPKSSLQKSAVVLGISNKVGSLASGLWPGAIDGVEAPLSVVMQEESPDENDPYYHHWRAGRSIRDFSRKDEEIKEMFRIAVGVEGVHNNHGTHAAAVLITPDSLSNFVPLHRAKKEEDKVPVCEYDKNDAEAIGGLKMDFLGLINLEIIKKTLVSIKRDLGVEIDINNIPLDDKKTFKMLSAGETDGVFQLTSPGMRDLLRRVNPTNIEDISAVLALYRPGPMGTDLHIAYADAKNGRKKVNVPHEYMHEMFKETYGVLCVTGDTMIWDAKNGKKVRIDSIESAVKSGDFYTIGVDENGVAVSRQVSNFIRSGKKDVIDITLANGKNVRVSATHPVLTPNGWVGAGELSVGDMMGAPKSPLPISANQKVSIDEARLLGYLLGDGYITGKVNGIINTDPDIIENVVEIVSRSFPDVFPVIETRERSKTVSLRASAEGTGRGKGLRGNAGESIYDNLSVNIWLRELGINGSERSRTKFIPDAIFASGNEAIANLIATLWDCDGHVGNRGITFLKTISEKMAKQTVDLLAILGIHATVQDTGTYVSQRHGETKSYGVYVYDSKFWEIISPLMASSKKNVAAHTYSRNYKTLAAIEVVEKRLHDVINENRAKLGYKEQSAPFGIKAINGYLQRTGSEERIFNTVILNGKKTPFVRVSDGLISLLREYQMDDEFERSIATNWSPIKEIKYDEPEEMYDISVEDVHNFIGNDVILHNCYQEQVMALAQHYASYSAQDADDFRKAVGKKDAKKLAEQEDKFKDGVIANGFGEKVANDLWAMIPPFAAYAFNKAHSVVYAFIAYWTAWLKANYTAQYAAACIDTQDRDRRTAQVASARKMHINVFPPNINQSDADSVTSKDGIWLGLSGVRNCGGSTLSNILAERRRGGEFSSVGDFMVRMAGAGGINKQSIYHLAAAGAFDSLAGSRLAIHNNLEKMLSESRVVSKSTKASEGMFGLFGDEEKDEPLSEFSLVGADYSVAEKISAEIIALGFPAGDHPFTLIKHLISSAQDENKIDPRAIEVGSKELIEGAQVFLYGTVTAHKVRVPKNGGKPQHNFILENDNGDMVDVVWFGGNESSLSNGQFAVVGGTFQVRELTDSEGNPYEKSEVRATSVTSSSIDDIINGVSIATSNIDSEELHRSVIEKKRAERRRRREGFDDESDKQEVKPKDLDYDELLKSRRRTNRVEIEDAPAPVDEAPVQNLHVTFYANEQSEVDELIEAMENMVDGDVYITIKHGTKKYVSDNGVKIKESTIARIAEVVDVDFDTVWR